MSSKDVKELGGTILKLVKNVVIPAVAVALFFDEAKTRVSFTSAYIGSPCYSDAINAVMNSTMWSNDKQKAIDSIPSNAAPDLYKAVMTITDSTMWSNDKCKAIQRIFSNP